MSTEEVKAASPLERLHFFCQRGALASVMEIYSMHKNLIHEKGNLGNTALHWAAHSGHSEIVETLLFEGADDSVQNDVGDTALHLASWNGHASCVSTLLKFHAKQNIKNKDGKLASDLARKDAVKIAFSSRGNGRASIAFVQEDEDSD